MLCINIIYCGKLLRLNSHGNFKLITYEAELEFRWTNGIVPLLLDETLLEKDKTGKSLLCTVLKIRNIYFQKWNCSALFPISNFILHVSGSNLCIPMISLVWNLYFLYCARELSAKLLANIQFPIWKMMHHKWKHLILVVNFLFGLRVNEISHKIYPYIGLSPALYL